MLEKMQEQIKKGVTMFALHELDDTKQKDAGLWKRQKNFLPFYRVNI